MMSQKVPSYVFSKALAQSGEEKQRRQSLPPNWGSEGAPRIKVPPPVALKPKSQVPFSIPEDGPKDEVNESETARRSSLPFVNGRTRTSSGSSDKSDDMDVFGIGQKMGGAFARLQRQIEAKETHRDLYSEAYQSYKAQRSLTAHGVLPKDMREDDRKYKYSLDSNNNVPPVLLPKPISRMPSAGDRRHEFGKARAMTSPASAAPPVLPNRQHRAIEKSAENMTSEADIAEYRRDYGKPDAVGELQYSPKPVPGLPDAPPIADPAAVERMQKEYREKQDMLAQGREELDKAISQLENADELLLDAHPCARTKDVPDVQETVESIKNLSLANGGSGLSVHCQVPLGNVQECIEHSCGA